MPRLSSKLSTAILGNQTPSVNTGRDDWLDLAGALVGPVAMAFSWWAIRHALQSGVGSDDLIVMALVFVLAFPGHGPMAAGGVLALLVDTALNWAWILVALTGIGWATGYLQYFSRTTLIYWVLLGLLLEWLSGLLFRWLAPVILLLHGPRQRAVVVGVNEQGRLLANALSTARYSRTEFVGFVDSRHNQRLELNGALLLGGIDDLATLVTQHRIQLIYLSLPMLSQPRILKILDDLKDTTASIYFVPDMFITDLIQGHMSTVHGIPTISVCDTPFVGFNGFVKRLSDVVFSLIILALIAPLLLCVAIGVKTTSPGPVIFKQRRYGLDGDEILVYKFRSMSVTENGDSIRQAQKNDLRVTPFGAFLRRTSIDELPQFVNVLQGRMSIVGPRPHAVAHNELYRKLIKGYMVRHKVKPGITGWAQVNGYRGETDTLDKMQGRIAYDLDYLRHWSLRFDCLIIWRTILLVLKDRQAY